MRLILAFVLLASVVSAPAMAQSCETISVRNASGKVISSKEICADENGKWIDPAAVIKGTAPASNTGEVFTQNRRETVQRLSKPVEASVYAPPALTVQPEAPIYLPSEPAYVAAPQVYEPAPPVYVAPEPVYVPTITSTPATAHTLHAAPVIETQIAPPPAEIVTFQPAITENPAPKLLPAPSATRWQPTSGQSKRQQLYAKLGLRCVAKQAKFCGGSDCTGLCTGQSGWCDGKTGELYPSLEAIERVYCRKIKRR